MNALGSFLNSYLTADWGFAEFALSQMLRGAALMLSYLPMLNLALGTLSREEVNNAGSLFTVSRNIGGALGLAAITTLINYRNRVHWQNLAEATTPSLPAVRDALATVQHALTSQMGGNGKIFDHPDANNLKRVK